MLFLYKFKDVQVSDWGKSKSSLEVGLEASIYFKAYLVEEIHLAA